MIIKLAKHKPTNRIIHIDHAENGLACGCVCESCGENLQAVQGKEREKHFRHNRNTKCKGAIESLLHQFAKQVVCDNSELLLPNQSKFKYEKSVLEPIVGLFRADVKISSMNETLYCEIIVTNGISERKEFYYRSSGNKCLEIDLRQFIDSDYTYEELRDSILNQTNNKRLIQGYSKTTNNSPIEGFLKLVGIAILLYIGYRFIRWVFRLR